MKIKLTFGFLLSLFAVVAAGYFTYSSFQSILVSIEELTKPDSTSKIMSSILNDIIESENDIRIYTMNEDTNALNAFTLKMNHAELLLDSLMQENIFIQKNRNEVDSLVFLLSNRADLIYALVDLKSADDGKLIAAKAMSEISSSMIESSTLSIENTKQEIEPQIKTSNLKPPTESEQTATKEKKKKGIFNFNKKKDQTTETENAKVSIDTTNYIVSINKNDRIQTPPAIDPADLRKILSEINQDEKRYAEKVSKQEIAILASDKFIMQNFRTIVTNVEEQYEKDLQKKASEASEHAQKSTKIIFGISLGSLLIGLIFLVIIVKDINQSIRYKNQLEVAKDEAEHFAKAKEQFLANMSHEIRTPLNAIMGFTEQLKSTHLGKEQSNFVAAVENASDHLYQIVNDILDLSKMDAGKIILQRNIFCMSELIESVQAILKIKAEEKGIELFVQYGEFCDQKLKGDDFRLKQVLFNIVGNAIKFTHSGYVKIICSGVAKYPFYEFAIDIIDTGIGISEKNGKHIFDDFEQAESGTTKKYGGTGLGLSISKKILTLLGGNIQFSSEVGKGSAFKIFLTFKTPNQKELLKNKNEITNHLILNNSLQVLVVDDEMFNLKLAEIILKKHNLNCTLVSSAQQAFQSIKSQKLDIAFIDLHMPDEDGFELTKKLRLENIEIPIIALTANVIQNENAMLKESGFNDILTKPYKENDLVIMINKWCSGNQSEKEKIALSENQMEINTGEGSKVYSLHEIELFTEGDQQLLVSVLKSFIESSKLNISILENAFEEKNIKRINDISHKMLPGYGHLKISRSVSLLKKLETAEVVEGSFKEIINAIKIENILIFKLLEDEIQKLEIEV